MTTLPGAPLVHAERPGNVVIDFHYGDTAKVDAAIAGAAHVTRLSLVSNRIVVNPMEPRSAIAHYDAAKDHWTLMVGCQGVFGLRASLARDVLKVDPARLRVLTGNVGGSFGMKTGPFPEYVCLFHATRILGRAVKWTDERSESFMSDTHGRGHEMSVELALDAEGRFLALRVTGYGNAGAYPMIPLPYTVNAAKNIVSVYKTPLLEVTTKGIYTNTSPASAYRGAGRPEGNYYMERLIETAALEMGIDRLELRRRNFIASE